MHKQFIGWIVIVSRIETDILYIQAKTMLTEFLMKEKEADGVMAPGIEETKA